MNISFEDKVVMITGGARGQGLEHTIQFAKKGAKIIVCDICENIESVPYTLSSLTELEQLSEKLKDITNDNFIVHQCDVRNSESLLKLVQEGYERFGKIDVLINNAGVCSIQSAWEIEDRDWQAMIDVNLTGTWNGCKAVMPIMKKQTSGKIINIGSVAGIRGVPNLSHYIAAKHGVVGLTKGLAIDLAPYNINVNCICPGSVDTEMLAGLAPTIHHTIEEAKTAFADFHLLPGLLNKEDISHLILWLASDYSRSVTGAIWSTDKGWSV